MSERVFTIAMLGLVAVLLLCIAGIIYLSAANPARPIPDILVATPTLIVGAIVGIFVPRPGR